MLDFNSKYSEITHTMPWYLRAMNLGLRWGDIGAHGGEKIGGIAPGGELTGKIIGGLIGTGAGLIIGAAYPLYYLYFSKNKTSNNQPESQEQTLKNQDYKKSWYRLSREKGYTWDSRLFFGAGGGALIGGAIGSIFPGVGTVIGGVIGGAVGGLLGVIHKPLAKKFISKEDSPSEADVLKKENPKQEETSEITTAIEEKRIWYKESEADTPWFMRLFWGASAGAALGGAAGTIAFPGIGTVSGLALGSLMGGALALVSPAAFAGMRGLIAKVRDKNKTSQANPQVSAEENQALLESQAQESQIQAATPRSRWYQESARDVPWYERLGGGIIGGVVLGGAIGTVVPGIGNAIGAVAGGIIGGTAALASPAAFALVRKISSSFSSSNNPPNETSPHSLDVPWYKRLANGAFAGALVGAGIGTLAPGIGTAIGAVVGATVGAATALASPAVFSFIHKKFPSKAQAEEEMEPADQNFDKAWYMRAAGGAGLGAAVGFALGTAVPGIGNVVGGAVGAIVGAAIFTFAGPSISKWFDRTMNSIKGKLNKTSEKEEKTLAEIPEPAAKPSMVPAVEPEVSAPAVEPRIEPTVAPEIGVVPNSEASMSSFAGVLSVINQAPATSLAEPNINPEKESLSSPKGSPASLRLSQARVGGQASPPLSPLISVVAASSRPGSPSLRLSQARMGIFNQEETLQEIGSDKKLRSGREEAFAPKDNLTP